MSKEVRRAFQSFIKHYCYYCQTIFAYNGSVVPAPRTLLDLGLNNLGPKTRAVVCGGGTCKDTPTYQRYGILLFLYLRPWSPQATAYQRYASFVQHDDPRLLACWSMSLYKRRRREGAAVLANVRSGDQMIACWSGSGVSCTQVWSEVGQTHT